MTAHDVMRALMCRLDDIPDAVTYGCRLGPCRVYRTTISDPLIGPYDTEGVRVDFPLLRNGRPKRFVVSLSLKGEPGVRLSELAREIDELAKERGIA